MSEATNKQADEQTAVILDNLEMLLDGDAKQAHVAGGKMLRTVTGPAHFSGLAMGIAGIGAIFLKRLMPDDGAGTYAIDQLSPKDDRDPKLNAMRVMTMLANGDNETASAIAFQMDQGDMEQSSKFLAAVLTNTRGIYLAAKDQGLHTAVTS